MSPLAHPKIENRLLRFTETFRREGLDVAEGLSHQWNIKLRGDKLLIQARLRQGENAQEFDAHLLEPFGARLLVRGTHFLDLSVPIHSLEPMANSISALAWLEAQVDQVPQIGGTVSQGVTAIKADRAHCRGITGLGIQVAVMDISFGKWSAAVLAGELPHVSESPPESSSTHGTACAEILADSAPGVTIHPVFVNTLAMMEKYVHNDLAKDKVQILSRSIGSLGGGGFGPNTNRWCEIAKSIHDQGAVLVNSAGNFADGWFYQETFSDLDSDGWHEFAPGNELNKLEQKMNGYITLQLDWQDYPESSEDYNLFLLQKQDNAWKVVASSQNPQTGSQEPREFLSFYAPIGTYALGIHRYKGQIPKMLLRVYVVSGPKLETFQNAGSLNTIAECPYVISVGAIKQKDYLNGPKNVSSSEGPTWDGRIKPDLVAPTFVDTMVQNDFSGTSAAAPHVAGAIALYMQATGKPAEEAAAAVIQDAIAMGTPQPNNAFGHGRLELDAKNRMGWECERHTQKMCVTPCGSEGFAVCDDSCVWSAECQPPPEICNGFDDDCDRKIDEDNVCNDIYDAQILTKRDLNVSTFDAGTDSSTLKDPTIMKKIPGPAGGCSFSGGLRPYVLSWQPRSVLEFGMLLVFLLFLNFCRGEPHRRWSPSLFNAHHQWCAAISHTFSQRSVFLAKTHRRDCCTHFMKTRS